MSFQSPLMLLTLLVLPAAGALYLYLDRRPVRHALTFTNLDVLAAVVPDRSLRRYVAPLLALTALASLCVALARPHRTSLVPTDNATVVLVVDVSGSMAATDVKPTRLGAAEAAVRLFLKKVPKNVRIALVAFSGEPETVTSPTTDHTAVEAGLDSLADIPGYGGTAIGDAIAAAVQLVEPTPPAPAPGQPQTIAYRTIAAKKSPYSILFLSDGHQNRGVLQPLQGAARAKAAGIPVYTIALGTPNGVLTRPPGFGGGGGGFGGGGGGGGNFGGGGGGGGFGGGGISVPPDPATLRAIAQTTGGKFFDARSAQAVSSAYSSLGSLVARRAVKREATDELLALAAILLVAAGGLSAVLGPRLP